MKVWALATSLPITHRQSQNVKSEELTEVRICKRITASLVFHEVDFLSRESHRAMLREIFFGVWIAPRGAKNR